MRTQENLDSMTRETNSATSVDTTELFDPMLSHLVHAWRVNTENIDVSSRVAAVIAEDVAVALPAGSEPDSAPEEFLPYLEQKIIGAPALTDFSGTPVASLDPTIPLLMLNPEQEQRLARAVEQGRSWAREVLVNANLRLVTSIAKKYQNRGIAMEDLIQEGTLGLIHAVDKFDYRRGFRFSTYATHWIRQALGRAVENQGRMPRLGGLLQEEKGDTVTRSSHSHEMASSSVNLRLYNPEAEALSMLAADIALRHKALPMRLNGNRLWVAMRDPRDRDAVDAIRMATRCLVQPMATDPIELERALSEAYGSLQPPRPPQPPTVNAAPAPEPGGETSRLLRDTLSELRGLREELASLRSEVAELRRDRSAAVPRPSTARLFPYGREIGADRNR